MRRLAVFLAICLHFVGVLSAKAVCQDNDQPKFLEDLVRKLSSRAYEGRKTASLGSTLSAYFIAGKLRDIGLNGVDENFNDHRSYFLYFTFRRKDEKGKEETLVGRNIIGYFLPEGKSFQEGYILLSAHYDHLGARLGKGGQWEYFPGANDNASGVSILLALARQLALEPQLASSIRYPLVFLFTDAEELGLKGAEAFIENPPARLLGKRPILVINLDTVGLFADKRVLVASAAEIREKEGEPAVSVLSALQEIGREIGFSLELVEMAQGIEAGDHLVFIKRNIPTIFFFGGAPPTYHKPTDTLEKLDFASMAELTSLLFEFLLSTEQNASFSFKPVVGELEKPESKAERAFLGTIPDFAKKIEGGVAISGVVPGSPAEKAGLKAGDIIRKLAGKPVADLRSYSEILKSLSPGVEVELIYEREGKLYMVVVRLSIRDEGTED